MTRINLRINPAEASKSSIRARGGRGKEGGENARLRRRLVVGSAKLRYVLSSTNLSCVRTGTDKVTEIRALNHARRIWREKNRITTIGYLMGMLLLRSRESFLPRELRKRFDFSWLEIQSDSFFNLSTSIIARVET